MPKTPADPCGFIASINWDVVEKHSREINDILEGRSSDNPTNNGQEA